MTRLVLSTAALAMLVLFHSAPAQAQNAKSWVSGFGNDANACTFLSPCATFQRAFNQTNAGGEVGVVVPGDFGTLDITKAVGIVNDGSGEAYAAGVFNLRTIFVEAGAGDVVSFRGLTLDGHATADSNIGLEVFSASAVHIQNCVIKNYQGTGSGLGLFITPINSHSTVFVSDTLIYNNGTISNTAGILIQQGAAGVDVFLDRVHVENNVEGISIGGNTGVGAHVVIRDSVLAGNAANGVRAHTTTGPAFALVERSSMVGNHASGILADGAGATILLKESTITRNGTGVSTINSGQLISYGTNTNNNNLGAEGAATGFLSSF